MNHKDYLFLSAEVSELEAILEEMPVDRVLDRMGFESRLKEANEELAQIPLAQLVKKASLTFRGSPVFGSHGIAAEFANKASGFFTEAFAAIVAGINENLRYMGPIADKQRNQLIITGTAIGSFGFEYELPSPNAGSDPAHPELDLGAVRNTEAAMEKMEELFRLASAGSDDDLSGLVDELHPRAVRKVAEFLNYVADQDAWCGLDFNSSFFRFSGSGQVRRSADRLTGDNIIETREEFFGRFEGALPTGRTFEFNLTDQRLILRGKVGPDVKDPNVLNREYLYKPAVIELNVVQVGQGRPRYTLTKLDDIKVIG